MLEIVCRIARINLDTFSKFEKIFLEVHLYSHLYNEFKKIFQQQQKDYFRLMKYSQEQEEEMLEAQFIVYMVNDILSTQEYSIEGIARYTHAPIDVIYDIAAGRMTDPSYVLSRKIIVLHHLTRPALYAEIIKRIAVALADLVKEQEKQ